MHRSLGGGSVEKNRKNKDDIFKVQEKVLMIYFIQFTIDFVEGLDGRPQSTTNCSLPTRGVGIDK